MYIYIYDLCVCIYIYIHGVYVKIFAGDIQQYQLTGLFVNRLAFRCGRIRIREIISKWDVKNRGFTPWFSQHVLVKPMKKLSNGWWFVYPLVMSKYHCSSLIYPLKDGGVPSFFVYLPEDITSDSVGSTSEFANYWWFVDQFTEKCCIWDSNFHRFSPCFKARPSSESPSWCIPSGYLLHSQQFAMENYHF